MSVKFDTLFIRLVLAVKLSNHHNRFGRKIKLTIEFIILYVTVNGKNTRIQLELDRTSSLLEFGSLNCRNELFAFFLRKNGLDVNRSLVVTDAKSNYQLVFIVFPAFV